MDFHSYLAHTEIIGLLGGRFDAKSRELIVESVFPCHSTSTGIQVQIHHIPTRNKGNACYT